MRCCTILIMPLLKFCLIIYCLLQSYDAQQPDIFILGVQKGGTTSLAHLLKHHPEICNSQKEPHFFDTDEQWNKGPQFYARYFATCDEESKTYDATPIFHNDVVSARISRTFSPSRLSQQKFVVVLREPVAREFSLYEHRLRACSEYMQIGKDYDNHIGFAKSSCYALIPGYSDKTKVFSPRTFREYFELEHLHVEDSDYVIHLRRWLQVISRKQLLILNMQTLVYNTTDTMRRLQLFFNLTQGWGDNATLPHDNESAHMHGILDCDTYDDLRDHYDRTLGRLDRILTMPNRPDMEPAFPEFENTREKCVDVKNHVKTPAITFQINKPNFFIIGVQKGGTTSLHELMVQNPEICSLGVKEKHFFSHDDAWEKGLGEYQKMFSMCPDNKYTIDASPMFRYDTVPPRLQISYAPNNLRRKKFILILREPVAREFSWYEHQVRECMKVTRGEPVNNKPFAEQSCKKVMPSFHGKNKSLKPLPFKEMYRQGRLHLEGSHYKDHMDNWLKVVSRDQIFVVSMVSLITDTAEIMRRIKSFLGLEKGWGPNAELPHDNDSSHQVPAKLDCWTFDALSQYYADKNQGLLELINSPDKPEDEPDFPGFENTRAKCVDME